MFSRNRPDRQFPSLPILATPYRFRLGVPSYVYPADILSNVAALASRVDDIEILLFESASPLPAPATIEQLSRIALEHELTYTVHLPIDRQLGSPERAERIAHQHQIFRILARTRPLKPFAYILHLDGIEPTANAADIKVWQDTVAGLLPAIVDRADKSVQICIENLAYPFEWCDPFLERFGLGVCLDAGHLTLSGGDIHRHFEHYADRLRVIHLHGVKDGKDHLPLTAMPAAWLGRFLNSIDNFTGVLTLELFEFEAVLLSMERLTQCLARRP